MLVPVKEEEEEEEYGGGDDDDCPPWVELGFGRRAPEWKVMEVLRGLPPSHLAAAVGITPSLRECLRRVWDEAEEVRRVTNSPDMLVHVKEEEEEEEEYGGGDDDYPPWVELGFGQRASEWKVMEVLRNLPPSDLAAAVGITPGLRECLRRVWDEAEEVRLRASGVDHVQAIVARCPALPRLVLRMESDVDSTLLECIAYSCPNLQSLDISMASRAANWITGYAINQFVSDMQSMSVLILEGCSSLGFLDVSSSSLSTLWLSGLRSLLPKVVINCPNLTELSLDFPEQNYDSTDLVALVDSLGRTCPNLRILCISSIHLCNKDVFALESANLRGLCMLALVQGSKINDAAVASIVRSYPGLELLDLSGSSITDNGVGMIIKTFPNTLTHLLLPMCPNITLNGVQVAVAMLPLLRLMDCGMSIKICSKFPVKRKQDTTCLHKLIIKHNNLEKLSLWGCSGIDALYVCCPELVDLNLKFCTNILPEGLRIRCPKLEEVHVNGCPDMLIGAVRNQVLNEFAAGAGSPRRRRTRLVQSG